MPMLEEFQLDSSLVSAPPAIPQRGLLVAIIHQALCDARNKPGYILTPLEQQEAINWLNGNSRWFRTCCELAGLDPDYVRGLGLRREVLNDV